MSYLCIVEIEVLTCTPQVTRVNVYIMSYLCIVGTANEGTTVNFRYHTNLIADHPVEPLHCGDSDDQISGFVWAQLPDSILHSCNQWETKR